MRNCYQWLYSHLFPVKDNFLIFPKQASRTKQQCYKSECINDNSDSIHVTINILRKGKYSMLSVQCPFTSYLHLSLVTDTTWWLIAQSGQGRFLAIGIIIQSNLTLREALDTVSNFACPFKCHKMTRCQIWTTQSSMACQQSFPGHRTAQSINICTYWIY